MNYVHEPVMLEEVIDYLKPKIGEKFIDGTLGGGGYTLAISKLIGESGEIIAIDLDRDAISNTKTKIKKEKINNIKLINGNFKDLSKIIQDNYKKESIGKFDGIVFDLGLSSYQLEDRSRGFSFRMDAPIDMEFDGKNRESEVSKTEEILNNYNEEDLIKILKELGEERFARNIVRNIIKYRENKEIKTTGQLVAIIKDSIPKRFQRGKIHPATKTFQALRIATNTELQNLEEMLPQAMKLLKKGGRIVIVTFHSLEDRIVKHFFKDESKECICPPKFPICQCDHKASFKIITKKPIVPTEEEVLKNPRSRSAKLRAAEKI
jgi:16S rRNA (cytosine1402-N4)-methyltransferase